MAEDDGIRIECPQCGQFFSRRSTFDDHTRRRHGPAGPLKICGICTAYFETDAQLRQHWKSHSERYDHFALIQSAHSRRCRVYQRCIEGRVTDMEALWTMVREQVKVLLLSSTTDSRLVKYSVIVYVYFALRNASGQLVDEMVASVRTEQRWMVHEERLEEEMTDVCQDLSSRLDQFTTQGSGWTVERFTAVNVEIGCPRGDVSGSCSGMRGCGHLSEVRGRKHLIDLLIARMNHRCFYIAYVQEYLRDLPDLTKAERTRMTKLRLRRLNTKNLPTPMKLRDLRRFENKNPTMGVNVFLYKAKTEAPEVHPVYRSTLGGNVPKSNVLLLECKKGQGWHFVYIRDLSRFLSAVEGLQRYWCSNCMCRFGRLSTLKRHEEWCLSVDCQKITYPSEDVHIAFSNYKKKIPRPVIGFADFETKLIPVNSRENGFRFNCELCMTGAESGTEACRHKTRHLNDQVRK